MSLTGSSLSGVSVSFFYTDVDGVDKTLQAYQPEIAGFDTTGVAATISTPTRYEGPIPKGASAIKAQVTALAGGSLTVYVGVSPVPAPPPMQVGILKAGTAAIGGLLALNGGGTSLYSAWGSPGNAVVSTTPVLVKALPAALYGLFFYNPNTSAAYLQIYNAASTGSVTPGTTVAKETFFIPPGGVLDRLYGPEGKLGFSAGIVIAATAAASGSGTLGTGLSGSVNYV